MPRLILLLAIAAVVYILYQRARRQPPHKRRAEYIKLGLIVAVIVVIGLTVTGRMHWIGAALTGLLVAVRQMGPTLLRLFPMLTSLKSQARGPQQSTVETACLRVHLDHVTGKLSGEVLKGPFSDWFLDEMDRGQLDELMQYCQREDSDSAQLLAGYVEQRFPGSDSGQQQTGGEQRSADSGGMTRKEALAILGLGQDASDDEISAAHRSLIQKLHPDRGGSDYLAARINEAKDFLLG
ncbi:DnaJ domain-containing protein [Parahaliea aestuarii]|uniref:DnaJ domain-containing protein n=1 Tax=Parahaliea aestuarii TaxID=1852021 RepID=A0A5C9A724_9GAMM|nr:DnaJ domain-containing protein [Parahaliea aestuarii]TXS95011.1 DnaJ domain-containing protein [Parahaliea aestuarii]